MKLLSYVATLLKHMDKDQVLSDLRDTNETLKTVVTPIYRTSSEFFRGSKIQSKKAQELQSSFYLKFDRAGVPKANNFITDIEKRLPDIIENVSWLEDQVEKIFEKNIIVSGMTARQAAVIRSAEQMSFLARYMPDLLNFVFIEEALHSGADVEVGIERLSPAEEKNLREGFPMFCTIMSDFGVPNRELVKMYVKIPDVNIGGTNAEMVAGLYSESTFDPFRTAFMSGFTWSPIYHFRMVIANWQNSVYKNTQDKKKMLELRLLHLELLREKKYDPKIEQEIEYTRNRVAKYDRHLKQVQDELNVEA